MADDLLLGWRWASWPIATEAGQGDLVTIHDAFAHAAARAVRTGIDVVEVRAAHGCLLHQFLSRSANGWSDGYGGTLNNRMCYPLEVIGEIRAGVPDDRAVGMRISATDWSDGGFTLDEAIIFVRATRGAGIDYVCVPTGGIASDARILLGPGYQTRFAAATRSATGVQVRTVALITEHEQAQALLVEGVAVQIALGRAFLNDPCWIWQAALTLRVRLSALRLYFGARPSAISPAAVDIPPGTTATTSTLPPTRWPVRPRNGMTIRSAGGRKHARPLTPPSSRYRSSR
jgi:NADPH2 dehydrogenase